MSYLRQVTGAFGLTEVSNPIMSRILGPLQHRNITKAEMDLIQPYYIRQLAKVVLAKMLMVNMFQLMMGEGLSINNDKGRKMMVKTPWKDYRNRPKYLHFLLFREAEQLINMIPAVGLGMQEWSTGPGRMFKSKLDIGLREIMEQLGNVDYAGRRITDTSGAISGWDQFRDRINHVIGSVTPSVLGADVDYHQTPGERLSTLFTVNVRKGLPVQKGVTSREITDLQGKIARETYFDEKVYAAARRARNMEELIELTKTLGLSPTQVRNILRKRAAYYSYLLTTGGGKAAIKKEKRREFFKRKR